MRSHAITFHVKQLAVPTQAPAPFFYAKHVFARAVRLDASGAAQYRHAAIGGE
jgi:hypothetical protein